MNRIPFPLIGLGLLLGLSLPAAAQEVVMSEKTKFTVVPFVDKDLDTPWSMAALPDGSFLVTEKPGRLRVIRDGKLVPEPIRGTPAVDDGGQGGLFDVQLHPDYAKNGWVYLAFSDPKDGRALTKIVRGRIKDGAWEDQQTIFEAPVDQYVGGGIHFGGRIQFDGKGHIFFTIGDRGDVTTPENTAQKLTTVRGKVHRLFDDGRIPPDNPFVNEPGAMKSIWSWGHRNLQGLAFDTRGNLWETEHGPRGGDEMNLILEGKNYGWPLVTYGINYSGTPITDKTSAPGMESPRINWTPSIGACGLDFYDGDKFPAWKGNLFAGGLAHRKVIRVEVDAANKATHQEILLENKGRVRSILCAPDGFIYVVLNAPDQIVKLEPAG